MAKKKEKKIKEFSVKAPKYCPLRRFCDVSCGGDCHQAPSAGVAQGDFPADCPLPVKVNA